MDPISQDDCVLCPWQSAAALRAKEIFLFEQRTNDAEPRKQVRGSFT